jgi:Rrf2 family protein
VELSSKVEYALLALLELASHHAKGEPLKVSEIAGSQGIPERYLNQILTTLRHTGIVQSQRGSKGGYLLSRDPRQITLLEVIFSLEGDGNSIKGEVSDSATLEKAAVLEIWQKGLTAFQSVFSRYTLQDLCEQRDSYQRANPMYYI